MTRWTPCWSSTGSGQSNRIAKIASTAKIAKIEYGSKQLEVEKAVDGKTEQLRTRTKEFALRIVHLFRSLPPATEAQVIGRQLLRSGTSVGANYRAACHARSRAEFIAKIGVVSEEADETVFWIELLADIKVVKK